MSSKKLALFGGLKTIQTPFSRYNSIGSEEMAAARSVVESGTLSSFYGSWGDQFHGGRKVQEFERACEAYFGVKHAITTNSWTSGLIAAVGALGIEPGDEVIVTPWTMSASATAILHWNAIPVFADIEPETFNLDPLAVEAQLSPHTRAIMAADIFGHSSDIDALMEIAGRHQLKVITDTAQSPGSFSKGRRTGTIADVGGYSLNYHKHIHTGEGGIVVTNDEEIAQRVQLIRNHAEAVVGDKGVADLTNMVGYNFRLGEIESAIGIEQLRKLDGAVETRQRAAARLTEGLKNLAGLRTPITKPGCTHSYYVYPMILDVDLIGVSRKTLVEALRAEGVPGLMAGYANVHLLPVFQQKIAFGSAGFPWTSDICRREISYARGICPVAEELHSRTFIGLEMCMNELPDEDVDSIVEAFKKVWENLDELQPISSE
jgi:perosamine synthetase